MPWSAEQTAIWFEKLDTPSPDLSHLDTLQAFWESLLRGTADDFRTSSHDLGHQLAVWRRFLSFQPHPVWERVLKRQLDTDQSMAAGIEAVLSAWMSDPPDSDLLTRASSTQIYHLLIDSSDEYLIGQVESARQLFIRAGLLILSGVPIPAHLPGRFPHDPPAVRSWLDGLFIFRTYVTY